MTYPRLCPACSKQDMQIFFELKNVPVHQNLLMPTRLAAQQCDRGDIVLGVCPACGFIANLAFDAGRLKYSSHYDNAQTFSQTFLDYMQEIAGYLIQKYHLYHKKIVEIGCGQGEFLQMLCELGQNDGLGFDPAFIPEQNRPVENIRIVKDFFSERYAGYQGDLVCARHVLEHIQYPAELISILRRSIPAESDTVLFFELPNVLWILQNLTFWDIFYEHCSYFSPGSLAQLFQRNGFFVTRVADAFGSQYLWLEASASRRNGDEIMSSDFDSPGEMANVVEHFTSNYREKMAALQQQLLSGIQQHGHRVVIWGAGAKGVTILNILNIPHTQIEFVIDINPRKQGKYIPGMGQQIVSPHFLKSYQPDVIFVMNPNYLKEVGDTVNQLGISAKLVAL